MSINLAELRTKIHCMSRSELQQALCTVINELMDFQAVVAANDSVSSKMSKDYQKLKAEYDELFVKYEALLRENQRLSDQNQLRNNDLFGRSTEKLFEVLVGGQSDESIDDPLSEDVATNEDTTEKRPEEPSGKDKKHICGKRTKGTRQKDLEGLPEKEETIFEPWKYDIEYGEGNWFIMKWIQDISVEKIPGTLYKKIVNRPVLVVPSLDKIVTIKSPYRRMLRSSIVSESLLAGIIYDKMCLSLPAYRQEQDFLRNGVVIRRSTMTRWINDVAAPLLYDVYLYMAELIREDAYNQCDETFTQVINDGRSANSKCFVWVHTTGELSDSPRIILFCFELTRATDHLRDFYEENDYSGTLTSDAYQAYPLLEKESDGKIVLTGCFMHCRRKFSEALRVLKLGELSAVEMEEIPEVKAQRMIAEIYRAETPLKELSAKERGEKRDMVVRPLVNEFFDYVRELPVDDPSISDRLKKAITYTLNQEEYLKRFLDDPNIPIDNGFVERCIRPYTIGRSNWKFNYSTDGASATSICYSIIETAKANEAHPFYYLKYLLERIPKFQDRCCKDKDYLKELMPWSKQYQEYEMREKEKAIDLLNKMDPNTEVVTSLEKKDISMSFVA